MLQRIALYATLGYLLDALAVSWTHWGFWCVLGLFWASEAMTRNEVYDMLNEELAAMRRKAGLEGTRDEEQEPK